MPFLLSYGGQFPQKGSSNPSPYTDSCSHKLATGYPYVVAESSAFSVQQTADGTSSRHTHGDIWITEDWPQDSYVFDGPDVTKRPDGRNAGAGGLVVQEIGHRGLANSSTRARPGLPKPD